MSSIPKMLKLLPSKVIEAKIVASDTTGALKVSDKFS